MQIRRRSLFHLVLNRVLIIITLIFVLLNIVPFLILVDAQEIPAPSQPFANSQFATVAGLDFHYRIWQDGELPVKGKLLLIHGLGGSTSNWELNVAATSQAGYVTVAVDLPGFGYSTRIPGLDHSQKQRSRWLWQLLDQIDTSLPAELREMSWILAGHSMGAGTAVAMSIEQPARTAELILVDGAIFDNASDFVATLMNYQPADRWLQVFFSQFVSHEDRVQGTLTQALGQPPTSSQLQSYRQPLLLRGTTRVFGDLVRTTASVPADGLKALNVPIAAIWGSDDTWVPLANAERIRAIRPDLDLRIIEGAHHLPMQTHADAFNSALLELLDKRTG